MQLATLLTFVFFTGLVGFLTWLITRKKDHATSTGYFLAGRSLTFPLIAGSLLLTNLSRGQRRKHVAAALALVGLADRARHYPRQLSGGQEQRVAIARAIVTDPTLLLCDEPTGALDSTTGIVVLEALARANRELGTTTVVITHNVVIAQMADRVIHMADGRIAGSERNEVRKTAAELSW